MERWLELAIAFWAAFIILGAMHYLLTWKLIVKRRMKPPWTYVVGVFVLMSVFAALEWQRGFLNILVDFAVIAAGGGLAVWGGYHLLDDRRLREENWQLKAALEKMGGGGDEERCDAISDRRGSHLGEMGEGTQGGDGTGNLAIPRG